VSHRPLTPHELDYLALTKASLDAALQALLVTIGLLAMPVVFLAFTLTGRGGWSGDRISTAIAGTIMLALVSAVVYYTALGRQEIRFDRAAFRIWRGLSVDLASKEAVEETLPISAKEQETLKGGRHDGPRRVHWLRSGDRRFRVSAGRWLSLAEGQTIEVAYAPHSLVVLTIDGETDRLRLPRQTEPDPNSQPIGGG
jgi:hypothetical protein